MGARRNGRPNRKRKNGLLRSVRNDLPKRLPRRLPRNQRPRNVAIRSRSHIRESRIAQNVDAHAKLARNIENAIVRRILPICVADRIKLEMMETFIKAFGMRLEFVHGENQIETKKKHENSKVCLQ